MGRIAPFQLDHPWGLRPRCSPPDHVDHRKVLRQRIALGDVHRRLVDAAKRFDSGLQLGRAHVLGGGIDQIAHQHGRPGLGQRDGDGGGVAGQQQARAFVFDLLAIAVIAVLPQRPAEQRGRGLDPLGPGEAIGTGGQRIAQPGKAPWAKAGGIGAPGHHQTVVAIGQHHMAAGLALELRSGQRGALPGRALSQPAGEAGLVDKVDLGGALAAIRFDRGGLDQGRFVGHTTLSSRSPAKLARGKRCAP